MMGTKGQQHKHKQFKPIIAIHQSPIGQQKSTQTSKDGNTSLENNMKHKAPCSSRGYSGLRESGPLKIDEGR
jgi:hypothetical protein